MSRNRRQARTSDSAAGQRSMGDFVSRAAARRQVEIIDDEDDEIEEINTQGSTETTRDNRLQRLRIRRQRREADQAHVFPDEEQNEEWEQLQQALMMSKLEADEQEERRKMCGTIHDVRRLQVEIEPLNSPSNSKSHTTETARKATGSERDQREGAESPDLFSTPPEDQEQLSDVKAAKNVVSDTEFPDSPPMPVTMRSPDASSEGRKETSSQQAAAAGPSVRQEKAPATKRNFKLRRTRREEPDSSKQKEKKIEEESKSAESEIKDQVSPSVNPGEKRKLEEKDDDDVTDDEKPIQVLKKRVSVKRKKPWVSLDNSDSDDLQDVEKKGSKRSPDDVNDPSPKRIAVSDAEDKARKNEKDSLTEARQPRTPTSMIRLSRRYKNTRYRPTTLKEAMKANIYFAPAGFDLPSYTLLILRMFEKYRRKLHLAQAKVKTRIPWGSPVVPGVRQGNTLDLKLPGKTLPSIGTRGSAFVQGTLRGATSTDAKSESDFDITDRRRTLRSSSNHVKQTTASTSTSKSTSAAVPPFKVDSDSDEGDFLKSYLDEMARPSVSTSTRKQARTKLEFVEDREARKTEVSGKPQVKTQKSSDERVASNVGLKNGEVETNEHAVSDQGSSDDVVLEPDSNHIQSNTIDSSAGTQENEPKMMPNKSGTSQAKLDGETSTSKRGVLPESKKSEDEVCLMDADQEPEAIRPPKRKSVLRPVIEDDSTDDESELSQPMFSGRFPGKETSVGSELPDSRADRVQDQLASQSLTQENESQRTVGKSVLETLAADNEELLPSQALLESDETSNKTIVETLDEDICDVSETSSSTARTSRNQAEQRIAEEEKLVVDVDCSDSQRARRMRLDAAAKAAAAAERRQRMPSRQDLRGACSSSSHDDFFSMSQPKENTRAEQQEPTVECPLCFHHFTSKEIEAHASECQGPPPSPPPQSYSPKQREEPGPSGRSVPAPGTESTVYRTLTGERGELKNLKVVLQRSPIAKQKLLRKATEETNSAKRNLDFEKNSRPSGSLDQYRSSRRFDQGARKPSRNTRAALRTESESEESGYEKAKEESSSEVYSWIDKSSPEKKKPKWTYGSSVGGNAPKLGGDYIPLNMTEESEDDNTSRKVSKEKERKKTSSRTEEVESDSETSDDGLMVQYGAKRVSARKKEPKQVQSEDTDENEIALALLGNRSKKRPLSVSKGSKAKKSRRPRDSDSEDSDELNIVCELCNKKIPKELYQQHVDEELEERKRATKAPRRVEVVTVKDKKQGSSKSEQRRLSTREKPQRYFPSQSDIAEDTGTDEQDHGIDWDRVSDSPIKCFQFTENADSVVDFKNQFEHLKQAKSGRRRSNYQQNDSAREYRGGYSGSGARGGYRGSGNRGNYKGSYNKVYGRGKKYGKRRGSRGKK
ncbi:uncharacterized protein LOC144642868 isoform X2 [Oculina patagonica]